jgi:hypothetical protein
MDVRNPGTAAFAYEAWQSFVMPGSFEIMPGSARATVGNLSEVDVLTATETMSYHDAYPGVEYGGSLSSLKNIANKASRFVQGAAKVGADVARVIPGGEKYAGYITDAGKAAGMVRGVTGGQLSSGGALNTGGNVMLRYKRR